MKYFLFIALLVSVSLFTHGQCLTDFSKLVPEPSVDGAIGFGNAVSMYDNYMAVGIPYHDTIGRATGIVHIYEFTAGNWQKVAALAPSDPADGIRFGITVKLTENYLLVGAQRNGGKAYLFKKGATGWVSGTELTTFSYPATSYFAIHSNRTLTVSDDEQTIAIADPYYRTGSMPISRSGAIFIYHKDPIAEWSGAITPSILTSPENDCQDFGTSGAVMLGNRLVTATPHAPTGIGRIYVYVDSSPGFQSATLEAKLDPGVPDPFDTYIPWATSLAFTQDGIFISGVTGLQSTYKFGILYFETPASGTWANTASPTCYIEPKSDGAVVNKFPFHISSNGSDIFASVRDANGNGYFHIIRKGATGWCTPSYELIDYSEMPPAPLSNNYGQVHAVNQTATAAVIGFVAHPDNTNSMIALRALNKSGATWERKTLASTKKSTAGHYYGKDILGFDDYLFASAPYDGTVKPNAGAVYSYKKVGNTWQKTGKILPPLGLSENDDVFGTALASNKEYLAVGAAGHGPKGKVFMYRKTSTDWSSVELVQEVTIPEEGLTVYAYGDNVAMDDDWLIIPYVQNAPARVILAIFKFNGTTWDFRQVAEIGNASFFAKESTLDVAIENGVMIAANQILELNSNDIWELKYTLSPSDPEPIRIAPDFSHWISNGSLFGHSVAIHDNTIFIGAPMRDFEDTWDVGAVYVYTKEPGESWSSRTESKKLVPRVKDENELFGYSIKALYNTLVVGAPGSDYDKNNIARNKPGRAYVFQAEDFYWQNVTPLIDFTGESFEKDYYGISVYLDETDFFIGASIEDIESAKLSGAVYVTPAPPIIKLVPPVCQSDVLINLFGYPFGGTWSGPGIVDAAEGIFDASLTGPGLKTFTYVSESCAYPGTLQIRVEPPVQALLLVAQDQLVCVGSSVSRQLSVQPQEGCSYQWYYRANLTQPFVSIGGNSPTIVATQRGEYHVKVFNLVCQTFSPIISVRDELADLQLTPVSPLCNNQLEGVALIATPTGGQWLGTGVLNNSFNPKNIAPGIHTLTYKLTSANGCVFQKSMQVEVRLAFNPVITRVSGDLCENGSVTLGLIGSIPMDTQINWMSLDQSNNNYTMLAQDVQTITIESNVTVKAAAENQVCESVSEPFELRAKLDLRLTPERNSIEVCSDDDFQLSFEHTPGNTYHWYVSAAEEETPIELNTNEHNLVVNETGYYSATVTRGVCTFESDPKYVFVLPRDSVFVPNVFTPNGDGFNDDFRVVSNQSIVSIDIFNRLGKTVFSDTGTGIWGGHGVPSGIYYWHVVYINCHDQRKSIKGWVHLIH